MVYHIVCCIYTDGIDIQDDLRTPPRTRSRLNRFLPDIKYSCEWQIINIFSKSILFSVLITAPKVFFPNDLAQCSVIYWGYRSHVSQFALISDIHDHSNHNRQSPQRWSLHERRTCASILQLLTDTLWNQSLPSWCPRQLPAPGAARSTYICSTIHHSLNHSTQHLRASTT